MLSDDGVVVVVVYSHNPSQLRIFIVYLYMLCLYDVAARILAHTLVINRVLDSHGSR